MKNKYSDLTYEMLPLSWQFCFINGCPKADECIRHITTGLIPDNREWGNAIFPTALRHGSCQYFKKIRKIRGAYGFQNLFKDVKRVDDKPLRDALKDYLGGHGTYYRYNNGEKLLTPEQQEWIINLFRRYGYNSSLVFDHYRESYDVD